MKQLKGSSYVISLDEKDIVGKGAYGNVIRAYDINNPKEEIVAKIM